MVCGQDVARRSQRLAASAGICHSDGRRRRYKRGRLGRDERRHMAAGGRRRAELQAAVSIIPPTMTGGIRVSRRTKADDCRKKKLHLQEFCHKLPSVCTDKRRSRPQTRFQFEITVWKDSSRHHSVIVVANMSNTAAPEFREVKKPQGGAHVRPAHLFRLDQRTIISEFTLMRPC